MKKSAIKLTALLLTLCMAVALLPALSANDMKADAAAVTMNYHSKTFWLDQTAGTHSGTVMSGGKLTLASGSTSGTFTSGVINIGSFNYMVASWNAQTNGGKVNVAVQYEVTGGTWSAWFSWGNWSSTRGVSGSTDSSATHGSISVDTLEVSSSYTTTGNIKFRVTLTNTNGIPVVSNVSVATPQMAAQSTVGSYPSYHLNNVPMRSQLASANGSIGNIICSPTSTAMALEYMGTYVSSLTAAYDMYDNNWGAYGNWSFAAAYAGEKGYTAFIDFYDVAMVKYALSQGVVLGCSTRLTDAGHIVLITGYDEANDQFIVNDPNVSESNAVVTRYTTSYFTARWLKSTTNNLGLVYVFQKDRDLQSFNGQSAADYTSNSIVKIKSVSTGKYLTNESSNNVSVKDSTDSAEQIWKITNVGNSRYSLVNAATGRYLDVANSGTTAGTNVQTYTSNGSTAQQFFLYKTGSNYCLRPSYSKTMFLDVNSSTGNVQLGTASLSTTSEQFVIESVSVALPTDKDYIQLTAMNASQYVSSVQIWTTGTFSAVYWGVLVLQPGTDGYTVAEKYNSGATKSVVASTSNLVLAIHQDQTDALAAFATVNVGDTVGLVGIYPGLGTMATNGYVSLPAGFKLIDGSAYTLTEEFVTIAATSVSVETAAAQFQCTVSVADASGAALTGDDIIGTGCTVQRKNASGAVIESVAVVIRADVTGDGAVTAADGIAIRNVLKSEAQVTGAFEKASDLNNDGMTSTLDYVNIITELKS